ncbi:hypothetical protein XI09_05745 [Bradyrhizobium sp. CCBAU 11386]|nr:hypothetical protein [Bradyrhizobium sp. CCBAU 11386]
MQREQIFERVNAPDILKHDRQRIIIRITEIVSPKLSGGPVNWSRLSEQNFRVDKWSVCRG